MHQLKTKKILVGDWMLVFDYSLEHHITFGKFTRQWFVLSVIMAIYNNVTYTIWELDSTMLRILVAGKLIKIFKSRDGKFCLDVVANFEILELKEWKMNIQKQIKMKIGMKMEELE